MVDASNFFQVSGTLAADAPSYVERPADAQLLDGLVRGELCLVLAPRQSGKSSLVVRALKRLADRNVRSGYVDLQPLGNEANPDRFFNSVMRRLQRELSLKINAKEWAAAHDDLSPTERFALFIEEVVLTECVDADGVVIAFDEVDSILKLPFSDGFFTTIRSLHNARATTLELRRLSFVLLGTATKSAFIKDRSRTPFNIGTEITLTDFNQANTEPFKRVLGDNSGQLVDRIFYWTSGQPLLVQKLASAAYSWSPDKRTPARLDQEVDRSILKQKVEQDTHLKFIRDYLLGDPALLRKTLLIYADVLNKVDVTESNQSPAQDRLKLAGVVRVQHSQLLVRNRIYSRIFDDNWIKGNIPTSFTDRPFKYQAAVVVVPLLVLAALWFLVRPYFYLRMPELEKEMYYDGSAVNELNLNANELKLNAMDAARAYLNPGGAVIEGGNLRLQFPGLQPGENTFKLVVEGDCLFEHLCFGEKRKEVEFNIVYYPGGEVRQFPNPALNSINPLLEVTGGTVFLKDASDGSTLWKLDGDAKVAILSPGRTLNSARMLVGNGDGMVSLWLIGRTTEVNLGNLIVQRIDEQKKSASVVTSLAFGRSDSAFVSGHKDGTVIYNRKAYKIFNGPVKAVVYGPQGFVAFSQDAPPEYYDEDGKARRTFKGHSGKVFCMAASPDNTMLATGGEDGRVLLWDIASGELRQNLVNGPPVYAVAFSQDGKYVLSGGDNLKLWEKSTGQEVRPFTLHVKRPDYVGFSPDDRVVFAQKDGGLLQVWDKETGDEIQPLTGHSGKTTAVVFSPSGKRVASAGADATVKLWDVATGKCKRNFDFGSTSISDVAFAPDWRTLIAGGGNIVKMWNVESGEVEDLIDVGSNISHIAIHPGLATTFPPLVAVATNGGKVDIIEVVLPKETDTNREQSLDSSGREDIPNVSPVKRLKLVRSVLFSASVHALAFSRDDKNLAAVALDNGTIELFNVMTGEKQLKITVSTGKPVYVVGFSPDGRLLATGSDDNNVLIWNANTGELVKSLVGAHTQQVTALAFSPDGETLASGSSDMTVRLWDVKSGTVLRAFVRHTGGVTGVAFSPDSTMVVSSSEDHTVKLWWARLPDAASRRQKKEDEEQQRGKGLAPAERSAAQP